ncbi:hypothetical protein EB810_01845 [Altererythrobacter sp. FM1]|nr:hypothetical protein EB810_01845 [Altererythrobacter sp. FM1]
MDCHVATLLALTRREGLFPFPFEGRFAEEPHSTVIVTPAPEPGSSFLQRGAEEKRGPGSGPGRRMP